MVPKEMWGNKRGNKSSITAIDPSIHAGYRPSFVRFHTHYKGLQEVILEGLFTGRPGRLEALGSYTDMSLTAARKAQSPQMFAQPNATNDGQYTNGYAISNKKGLHPPFGG